MLRGPQKKCFSEEIRLQIVRLEAKISAHGTKKNLAKPQWMNVRTLKVIFS